jgi:predicted Fe-S protein YdhL (DUF1289 family)
VPTQLPIRVTTPCIGVCSTGIGDAVCRGCKRYAHEVIHWNSYSDEQKRLIDRRLDQFLSQIVAAKLRIFDPALLERRLREQQIRFTPYKSAHVWIFQLLRAGASQIADCRRFGFALEPAWAGCDLVALRDEIDREFFALSEAHYQRYIRVG